VSGRSSLGDVARDPVDRIRGVEMRSWATHSYCKIVAVPHVPGGGESDPEEDVGPLLDPSGGPDEYDPDFDPEAADYARDAEWDAEPAEMAWTEAEVVDEVPSGWVALGDVVRMGLSKERVYELMRDYLVEFVRPTGGEYPIVFVDLAAVRAILD